MREKRKTKRLPIDIKLKIDSLYRQDNDHLADVDEFIEVTNISKGGIGFNCPDDMPIGYYFNAEIVIDNEKHFYSVLKIIRRTEDGDGYHFGCEFVGLADILSGVIDEYQDEIK